MRRIILAILMAMGIITTTAGCNVVAQTSPFSLNAAHFKPRSSFMPAIPMPGYTHDSFHACMKRDASLQFNAYGITHFWHCRILRGIEEAPYYDWRNWTIQGFPPLSVEGGGPDSVYGAAAVWDMGGKAYYEGCRNLGNNVWNCDYRVDEVRDIPIYGTAYGWAWEYPWRKLSEWGKYYSDNPLACAVGVTAVWTGATVVSPFLLRDCSSGPWGG